MAPKLPMSFSMWLRLKVHLMGQFMFFFHLWGVKDARNLQCFFACLFSIFTLWALDFTGITDRVFGRVEDRDNGEEEEDAYEDGNEEEQDAFVDAAYDRQSDVYVCKASRMVHFEIQLLLNSLTH